MLMIARRLHYIVFILLALTACQPSPSSVASAPTAPPVTKGPPTSPPATATRRASPTATATLTPTTTYTPNPKAFEIKSMFTALQSSELSYVIYVLPKAAPITSARLDWTFQNSKKTDGKDVILPPQANGQAARLEVFMPLDALPTSESTLTYVWTLHDEYGNTLKSDAGRFKLTEATRDDQRDDLPIIDSKAEFTSKFPTEAIFSITVTPENPITNARFFITQNHGIQVENYEAHVETKDKGQPLTVSFRWNSAFSLQIPWQGFETWWVFTDEFGKVFRTDHALNDYADKKHKWVRTPTRYTVLYTYGQSAANISTLVTATDKSVEALQKEFDYTLLYKPHIVVYNSVDDFKEWTQGDDEGGFIGMASGRWGGAVVAVYNSIKFTGYTIIKHELAHVFQYQSVQQTLPQWFIEGSARYMEDFPEENNETVARREIKANGAPSLQLAVPFITADRKVYGWPYYVGMTFVKFLKQKYGADAFAKTYLALARNNDLPGALKIATGKSFDVLDKEWQDWISQ